MGPPDMVWMIIGTFLNLLKGPMRVMELKGFCLPLWMPELLDYF